MARQDELHGIWPLGLPRHYYVASHPKAAAGWIYRVGKDDPERFVIGKCGPTISTNRSFTYKFSEKWYDELVSLNEADLTLLSKLSSVSYTPLLSFNKVGSHIKDPVKDA